MDRPLKYEWPGNVRELENVVERAVILSPGDYIGEKDLPLNMSRPSAQAMGEGHLEPEQQGDRALDHVEKLAISRALHKAGGNKSEAARLLGITRRTLYNKMGKYGLN